jgi:hypothetical protein
MLKESKPLLSVSREDNWGLLFAKAEDRSAVNRRVEVGKAPSEEAFNCVVLREKQ